MNNLAKQIKIFFTDRKVSVGFLVTSLVITAIISSFATIAGTQKRESNLSTHYQINQEVNVRNISLAVESVRYDTSGSPANQLKPDYQFLIATITLTNNQDINFELMPLLFFYVKDAQGNIYNVSTADIYGEQLTGPILPGENIREEVAFEIPISVTKPVLYFERGTPDHAVVAFDLFKR